MLFRVLCGFGLFVFLLSTAGRNANAQPDSAWRAHWEPKELVNGSAVLFRVSAPAGLKELNATWFDHKTNFRFAESCRCWYGLAGIGLDAKPGIYTLHLQGKSVDDKPVDSFFQVTINEKDYPHTEVTGVPGKYVKPPPELKARIEEESALKKQIFSRIEPESFWAGQFESPVSSVVTAIFGSARVVNKSQKTVHQGIDFRAPVGTQVRATNRGTVVLARSLYFEGNCVMIDHGNGLMTLYFHLSEFRVKEGDAVATGQLLGLSGNTGRVNGPHLHFAARWQGLYLDPETLLNLRPPAE